MKLEKARSEYLKRKEKYEIDIKELSRSISQIGNLRLLTAAVGISMAIYCCIHKGYIACAGIFTFTLIIFIYLVAKHSKATEAKKHAIFLRDINEKSLRRLDGDWKDFKDDGSEFKDENHEFSGDLDIFGKSSLFQWINSANTYSGRHTLKNRLTNPLKSSESIIKTQGAVLELASELDFRQQYEAEGMAAVSASEDPKDLLKWTEDIDDFYLSPGISIIIRALPVITAAVIILSLIANALSYRWGLVFICIQIMMLLPGNKKRAYSLGTIYKFRNSIKVYKGMLYVLEQNEFQSDLLKEFRRNIISSEGQGAAGAIDKLLSISNMISERNSVFYIILDIFLLWDYQCMIQLEKWKLQYGSLLPGWFRAMGEFEALSSIANIPFEHEDWAEPRFKEGIIVEAQRLGHPLLGENRVCNDVTIKKPTDIILITGSNMSGKSTFLRTVGLNLLLSYIGSTVCAGNFTCSILDIYTCMRISDNLEKSISSFYAEILRIKMIVEASKRGENVFFLLDEIFKGTNSGDRHTGAKLLIRQLGDRGASGIVSTHDLELSELEEEYSRIKNYHFQEYYEDNELKFDYKLRTGVSVTRNAMYLIKLAGIDVEDK